jgi:hypothetical protein
LLGKEKILSLSNPSFISADGKKIMALVDKVLQKQAKEQFTNISEENVLKIAEELVTTIKQNVMTMKCKRCCFFSQQRLINYASTANVDRVAVALQNMLMPAANI